MTNWRRAGIALAVVVGVLLIAFVVWAGLEDREDLEMLSVSGTRDGLATPVDIDERRDLLPDDTTFVEIGGMNHAQFGRYGEQARDLPPQISDGEAQAQRHLTDAHVRIWASTDH